jgi:hypothetical protein
MTMMAAIELGAGGVPDGLIEPAGHGEFGVRVVAAQEGLKERGQGEFGVSQQNALAGGHGGVE